MNDKIRETVSDLGDVGKKLYQHSKPVFWNAIILAGIILFYMGVRHYAALRAGYDLAVRYAEEMAVLEEEMMDTRIRMGVYEAELEFVQRVCASVLAGRVEQSHRSEGS